MATVESPAEQRFVLHDVDWSQYRTIADSLGERPVRLTYDRGRLEFMTLSHGHERCSSLLGRFIEAMTEELSLPLQSGGSTTFGRADLDRALEPDRCYYIAHESAVRNKDEIDLMADPPPDLAIEVDISRSSINRMAIYSAIGVPEVWRFDGATIRVYRLNEHKTYTETSCSPTFPTFSLSKITEFVNRRTEMDENSLVRMFRLWVREH